MDTAGTSDGLVLLGRPGCHLCDDARLVLERVGEPFDEVDITTDDALHATYLERIPVVLLDGVVRFELLRGRSRAAASSE